MTHSDEYLQMSGIQHFAFCRRQWALAYLEQQWGENLRTAEGRLEHARCHDEAFREKRGGLLTVRGMRVVSLRRSLCQLPLCPRLSAGQSLQRPLGAGARHP